MNVVSLKDFKKKNIENNEELEIISRDIKKLIKKINKMDTLKSNQKIKNLKAFLSNYQSDKN